MNKYYVYVYYDPRKEPPEPIYVGRGNGKRAYKHLTKCTNSILEAKINHIRDVGKEPIVEKVSCDLNFEDASALERQLILQYGRINIGTGTLCNFTDGGDGTCGYKHSEETKKLFSEQRKGKKQTEAQLAANRNRAPKSEATRLKHSLQNRGKTHLTPEQYAEIAVKARGRKMSEKSRTKMSEQRKGVRTEKQKALDVEKLRRAHEVRAEKERILRGSMNDEEWIEFKRKTYTRSAFYNWHKRFLKGVLV